MEKEFVKKDISTLIVTKPVEIKKETNEYNIDFLKEQEKSIIKQRDEQYAARTAELEEVQELISEAEKLGIKSTAEINKEKEIA
jgi:hypothetical protein